MKGSAPLLGQVTYPQLLKTTANSPPTPLEAQEKVEGIYWGHCFLNPEHHGTMLDEPGHTTIDTDLPEARLIDHQLARSSPDSPTTQATRYLIRTSTSIDRVITASTLQGGSRFGRLSSSSLPSLY